MNPKLRRTLKWVGYPAFYLFCLLVFLRLTFPYERVKDRIIAEFEATQEAGKRLEIDDLSGHWFSGVEAEGVRLITEAPPSAGSDEKKPQVLEIEAVRLSLALLRRIFGTLHVDFSADIGGGEIDGTFQQDSSAAEIEFEADSVDVGEVGVLESLIELPASGVLSGSVQLVLPEGKMKLAEGNFDLSIQDLTVGDGKAKIRNTIALPKLQAGTLTLKAEANEGRLDVNELSSKGKDFELDADGTLRLRDPFDTTIADLNAAFKFTDAYKTQSDITKGLFGEPGSKVPGLFDMDPQIRRAKSDDDFYRWRVRGPLRRLSFSPGAPKKNARSGSSDEKKK